MGNLSEVLGQLKKERERAQDEVKRFDAAIAALAGGGSSNGQRRPISAAGRRAISIAQKARWAKRRSNGHASAVPRRTMSAAARRKIAASQRARWATWRAKQKKAA